MNSIRCMSMFNSNGHSIVFNCMLLCFFCVLYFTHNCELQSNDYFLLKRVVLDLRQIFYFFQISISYESSYQWIHIFYLNPCFWFVISVSKCILDFSPFSEKSLLFRWKSFGSARNPIVFFSWISGFEMNKFRPKGHRCYHWIAIEFNLAFDVTNRISWKHDTVVIIWIDSDKRWYSTCYTH